MGVATQWSTSGWPVTLAQPERLQRRRKLHAFQSALVFRERNVLPDRDLCR
jgi:hypothetical protein